MATTWTRDLTLERNAAWCALDCAGAFLTEGKEDARKMWVQERRQGWFLSDLLRAMEYHGMLNQPQGRG
jgi:hypothetical protein